MSDSAGQNLLGDLGMDFDAGRHRIVRCRAQIEKAGAMLPTKMIASFRLFASPAKTRQAGMARAAMRPLVIKPDLTVFVGGGRDATNLDLRDAFDVDDIMRQLLPPSLIAGGAGGLDDNGRRFLRDP